MNKSTTKFGFVKPLLRKYYDIVDSKTRRLSLLDLARPLWRDVSKWQGIWRADIAYMNGVVGCIARAGHGLAADATFSTHYINAGNVGMYRSSYYAIDPKYPLISQLDIWYKQHPTLDIIPRVVDMELSGGLSAGAIGSIMWNLVEMIKSNDGVYPILYSRKNLIDPWLASWSTEQLNRLYYWLAAYLSSGAEHAGPPAQPNRVGTTRTILHQTSDHKVDFPGEADSLSIDWDRWMLGNVVEMRTWIYNTWGGTVPESHSWYTDIDGWARTQGFSSLYPPPGR